MNPILQLIVTKLIEYILEHADDIIDSIKNIYPEADNSTLSALQDLKSNPSLDTMHSIYEHLQSKNLDPSKMINVLLTKYGN